MSERSPLNENVEDVSEEVKIGVNTVNQILQVLVSGGMLVYSIYQIYDDNVAGRLNPLNPQVQGREASKLSGIFFAALPLLALKVLYHVYLMITNGSTAAESDRFKSLRHVLGIAILLVIGVSLGLSEHPSSEYCYDSNQPASNQTGFALVLKENVTLKDGDRINIKQHLQKCKIKDLIIKKDGDTIRYGEEYLTALTWLFVGAIILRFLGIFQDTPQLSKLIKWTDTQRIDFLKYIILAGSASIAVIAATIARAEDLDETVDGKRLLEDEDLVFFTVLLAFSWVHAGFILLGLILKILIDFFDKKFEYALLNNVPIIRGLVTTTTIACVSYITGAAAGLLIDYSFLSMALVAQVILDIFGRNKGATL